MNAQEEKKLQTRVRELKGEKETLKNTINTANIRLQKVEKEIKEIETRLTQSRESLRASEHAIVRYLERYEGLNLEDIEKKIITEKLVELYEAMGMTNGKYPNGDFHVGIKNGVITTVI